MVGNLHHKFGLSLDCLYGGKALGVSEIVGGQILNHLKHRTSPCISELYALGAGEPLLAINCVKLAIHQSVPSQLAVTIAMPFVFLSFYQILMSAHSRRERSITRLSYL